MQLSIIIPTYNEKDNIFPLIRQIDETLTGIEYEIIFMDDSDDDTMTILQAAADQNPRVRFYHRDNKKGLASAVVLGFGHATGTVMAVMDADLQHPPGLLKVMFDEIMAGADVVLPSRYIAGGANEGLSFIRTLASKGARLYSQIFLRSIRKISDPMSGYFMFRKNVIEGISFHPIGWKILIEVMAMGHYSKVVEIPYAFHKRLGGASKLTSKVMWQYIYHTLSLIFRSERERQAYALVIAGISGIMTGMLVFAFCVLQLGISAMWGALWGITTTSIWNCVLNDKWTFASKKEHIKYIRKNK